MCVSIVTHGSKSGNGGSGGCKKRAYPLQSCLFSGLSVHGISFFRTQLIVHLVLFYVGEQGDGGPKQARLSFSESRIGFAGRVRAWT